MSEQTATSFKVADEIVKRLAFPKGYGWDVQKNWLIDAIATALETKDVEINRMREAMDGATRVGENLAGKLTISERENQQLKEDVKQSQWAAKVADNEKAGRVAIQQEWKQQRALLLELIVLVRDEQESLDCDLRDDRIANFLSTPAVVELMKERGNQLTELLCVSCAGDRWADAIGGTAYKCHCPRCGQIDYLREFRNQESFSLRF